jgi:hypothetical protein
MTSTALIGASGAAPDPGAAAAPGAGADGAGEGGAGEGGAGEGGAGVDVGAAAGGGAGALAASASDAASAHAPAKIAAIGERVGHGTGESYRKSRGTSRAKYLCAGQ